MVQGTKGAHLVLDHPDLREMLGDDMVYYENIDGRICIMFCLHGMVLVGSTDIKVPDPDAVRCEADEQAYILDGLSWVFPGVTVKPEQVLHVFAGVRPLPVSGAGTTGQIPRGHFNRWTEGDVPVLSMIGGKWTTFRAFGELAADQVMTRLGIARRTGTEALPIGGGADYPADRALWCAQVAEQSGLSSDRVATLLERYGTLAGALGHAFASERMLSGLPGYSDAEIDYVIAHEQVERLADLALRRTTLALAGALDAAALDVLADRLAQAKGWSPAQRAQELHNFRVTLAETHGADPNRIGLHRKGEVAAQ